MKKCAKHLNRHFYKEDIKMVNKHIQMINKHMKRWLLTSCVMGKMQIKPTMR